MVVIKSLKYFFVFSMVTVITLKIVDVVVGLFFDSYSYYSTKNFERSITLREHAPLTDKHVAPSNFDMLSAQNLQQKNYRLRTDKNGFIIGPNDLQDEGKSRGVDIIFFGGSTTECIYIEEENRFPYLISTKLNKKDGKAIKVLNGGVSGNDSMHSFLADVAKGIPLKPKFVVLMHNVNDLVHLSRTGSYWDAPQSRSIVKNLESITKFSALYDLFRAIKNMLVPNIWVQTRHIFQGSIDKILTPDEWRDYRHKQFIFSDLEKIIQYQFRASLVAFVRVNRAWGIEPILMTQFNRLKKEDQFIRKIYEGEATIKNDGFLSYDEFIDLYSEGNDIVRDVAKQEKVFLIDLDKELESSSELIIDAVHLNTSGSQKVARFITHALNHSYPGVFYLK
jgi:hypothetical protein